MKSNKICSKLRKGANFAAANLPLRPQKTTMTDFQISSLSLINSQRKIAQEKVKMKLNSLAGNLKRKEHQGKEERRR